MAPRRPHEPLPPKADEIHRLAKRLVNIHGDQTGTVQTGRLSVYHTEHAGTTVKMLPDPRDWRGDVVFAYERDYDAEQKAVNNEFMQLGIPMKGSTQYWSMTEFNAELADEAISLMQQALVLDELSRVLGGDDDAETP